MPKRNGFPMFKLTPHEADVLTVIYYAEWQIQDTHNVYKRGLCSQLFTETTHNLMTEKQGQVLQRKICRSLREEAWLHTYMARHSTTHFRDLLGLSKHPRSSVLSVYIRVRNAMIDMSIHQHAKLRKQWIEALMSYNGYSLT